MKRLHGATSCSAISVRPLFCLLSVITDHTFIIGTEASSSLIGSPREHWHDVTCDPNDCATEPVTSQLGSALLIQSHVIDSSATHSKKQAVPVPLNQDNFGPEQLALGLAADGLGISVVTLGVWHTAALTLVGIAAMIYNGENLHKLFAEFIGTFMLLVSFGFNVLSGDPTWGVISIACTLMVLVYALGSVSGGHFNPAVSVAVGLARKMTWKDVCAYVCTQCAAGIVGGLTYAVVLGRTFNLGPTGSHSWWEAGLAEFIYTCLLCFVVLNTACSKRRPGADQFFGVAIAFSIVAGGYGAGAISGGCFNPAVVLGIMASSSGNVFGWCIVYCAFQVWAAALAAELFSLCRPEELSAELEDQPVSWASCLLSELIGTFILVLTVVLNLLAHSRAAVFSIACSLTCLIFSLGSVSGAHFNPAVTVAVLCAGREKTNAGKAASYIGVQVAAGILAALTGTFMHASAPVPLAPSAGRSEAFLGEVLFTFLLGFVVLSVATIESPLSQYSGLAIGMCVTAGGLAMSNISGGSLNPAVSLGLAVSHGNISFLPLYIFAEILGGILAAAGFRVTHLDEYRNKA